MRGFGLHRYEAQGRFQGWYVQPGFLDSAVYMARTAGEALELADVLNESDECTYWPVWDHNAEARIHVPTADAIALLERGRVKLVWGDELQIEDGVELQELYDAQVERVERLEALAEAELGSQL